MLKMEAQSLKEKVIKGSTIVFFMALVGSLFAYLIRVLFSRTLSIENYGLFYAALGLFSMVSVYIDLGLGYATIYLLPKYIKSKNYAKAWNIFVHGLTISLIMSVTISILLVLIAPFLAKNYFRISGSENLIYIFCIYLVLVTILNGLSYIYISLQKEKYYSSINVSKWLLIFVFSALFFFFNFPNVLLYAIAWAAAHLVTVIIFTVLFYRKHSFLTENKIIWEKKILKTLWSFALPSFLESMIYSLVILTDTFFLTLFRGVREAGIYNVIYPIASISIMLLNPINNMILPLVSYLMEGEKDKLTYLMNKVLEIVPLAGLYFALFIVMFPSSVIVLVFGTKWSGLGEAPLMIISLGCIGLLLSIILGTILIGTGKIRERLKLLAFTGLFYVLFNAIFIWKFGIYGVVITNTLMGISLSIMFLKVLRKEILFKIPYQFYFKLSLFSFLLYILVRLTKINPHTWVEFIAAGVVYTVIFILFGYVVRVYDKRLLLLIISNRIRI